ncbi:MAG TPA: hypothetical protein VN905_08885 [Candidatus Binatia bacterium]|nr:hypothetical protein [Candidatus Binatia bacterium]
MMTSAPPSAPIANGVDGAATAGCVAPAAATMTSVATATTPKPSAIRTIAGSAR